MLNGSDQQRSVSRRAFLRSVSLAVAAPAFIGCTLLDALDENRFTVEITDQGLFDPPDVKIPVGGTVVWRNMDTDSHTVTADPEVVDDASRILLPNGADPWDSGNLSSGQQWSHTFPVEGIYVYTCQNHEGMVATVTVESEG